jgi:glycosyltransferase involved in cell wall biosynthesis
VYIAEYTLQTRRRIVRAETSNPLLRWRREWWNTQLERQYEDAVRQASGLQCNGLPTYEAYRPLNQRTMLYFDTRVRANQLISDEQLAHKQRAMMRGEPLRLAFSGRLISMKGADHLPQVAFELKRLGVPFTMDICGGGDLLPAIARLIERLGLRNFVRLRGVLDFREELLPLIANEVDLFVCCHRQGDPSCTYLETMSSGTPIVGYDNEAFASLVRHSGTGWLSPLDDPVTLAYRIAEINADRKGLAQAAADSRDFASQHIFENTMEMRIDHLQSCAQSLQMEAKAS